MLWLVSPVRITKVIGMIRTNISRLGTRINAINVFNLSFASVNLFAIIEDICLNGGTCTSLSNGIRRTSVRIR